MPILLDPFCLERNKVDADYCLRTAHLAVCIHQRNSPLIKWRAAVAVAVVLSMYTSDWRVVEKLPKSWGRHRTDPPVQKSLPT